MRTNAFVVLFLAVFAAVKCLEDKNTCVGNNQPCVTNDDCCTENCVNQICTTPTTSCRVPGQICKFNYQCCSFSCTSTIERPFGKCLPCIKLTESCSSDKTCCSHYCNPNISVCETLPGQSSEE